MVRTAVAQVLLFIAAVSIAAAFAGTIVTQSSVFAQSTADEADRTVATIDAEIVVINDPAAGATYDDADGQVTLYVKNVGGETLEPAALEVVLDGTYVGSGERSTRVLESGDEWRVGTVLEVTIDRFLAAGEHRAAVTIDGARDRLVFDAG
ncbi:archaeal flagellar protein G [Natrinema marinum]|uniref:archaeal flagellar protein G n=1 Tax=Natrinema marinum TaxID=2961598 RepID=UPI0020C91AD2|nr:archaeal flagellar protein G [Natrinema marinum]